MVRDLKAILHPEWSEKLRTWATEERSWGVDMAVLETDEIPLLLSAQPKDVPFLH